MAKSPDAFRTISEVADWLGVEAHVLRFWETKFAQVKPVKRAGGRRYYRPTDMALLGGIRHLLYDDGLTIRGVQKVLREHGVGHVAALSPELRLDAIAPIAAPRGRRAAKDGVPHAEMEDATPPTLPFELPEPVAVPVPVLAPEEVAPNGGLADGVELRGASASGLMLAERIRTGVLAPPADRAAPILARARALARRLADRPE